MGVDERYRGALKDALTLWFMIEIKFQCWYDADRSENGKRLRGQGKVKRTLPPPIKSIERSSNELTIGLDKVWREMSGFYFVPAPLPLPKGAAPQNLVLWLLTAIPRETTEVGRITQDKTMRQICRTIGVNHTTRNAILKRAIGTAVKWFCDHGSVLVYKIDNDRIGFLIEDPKPPKADKPKKLYPDRPKLAQPVRNPKPAGSEPKPNNAKRSDRTGNASGTPQRTAKRIQGSDEFSRRVYPWDFGGGEVLSDDEYRQLEAHDNQCDA
jgi:hypothetical protein